MSIKVAITHENHYKFDKVVKLSPHVVRLRPAPHCRTPIEAFSMAVRPEKHYINWQQDPFGNFFARLVFPEPARELSIQVDLIANMTVINPFDFYSEEYAEHYPFRYDEKLEKQLKPYLDKPPGQLLNDWVARVDTAKQPVVDFLVALNQRLEKDIDYNIRMEPGVQACEETLTSKSGSCRDSAWLLVNILRHLGLAARFVSGYIVQLTLDEKLLDGPAGPGEDFTDLHAWAEVFVPGAGWLGLDPTSGLFAGEGHIPLVGSPEPESAAPVTGYTDPCQVEFSFHNTVTRIHEDPRVTKPFSDQQWADIDALGHSVDARLAEYDVRLTMGGEPTFVSADDMESPQWNSAALGKEKRELAGQLIKRLNSRFAPGGVLHYGQGKWYPGEPLPRWALSCYWRKDGEPVWRDSVLIADDMAELNRTREDAEQFIRALSETLGVDASNVSAAYEDAYYFLWMEGNLPTTIDPLKADLKDPLERRRLASLLESGLDKPAGFLLPLEHDESNSSPAWKSCKWRSRRGSLFLTPGDSAMGLRIPFDAIFAGERRPFIERDPFAPREKLDDYHALAEQRHQSARSTAILSESGGGWNDEESDPSVQTALCVEAREGTITVFLPPVTHLEHFLDLVASVEITARRLGMPVLLGGYEPPRDNRLQRFQVTPDPGVIEVNIHPAKSWDEMVNNTSVLYSEARQTRLATEKFMLDGRHTGTGGGNHITLGGETPEDSPLLRRPDLLRSLITYWQHHPSLSYLFSGPFIGPTSQAPRIDEARNDSLYELEIAFSQLPEGDSASPWLVDRLLRNILVDLTGNTHRAEFCIDKMYSPDGASGRLGLLEMRAFEMPPHARMSLLQMLLIRGFVARFWKKPYKHKLIRWGTELHDRFLLPHYVWTDFLDIIDDLNRHGYGFQSQWFKAFFEFRFPHYGEVQIMDMTLELRMAIEPWHVLGEESTSLGAARYVDSSVERLQVKITGMTDPRYALACNGQRIALRKTAVHGEYVTGVRYRAWQPPSALHPTIGVHVPLVFDLIDTWNGRAIGGCTYNVSNPSGKNYETLPLNAYEAEARRVARFWDFGHTPAAIEHRPQVSVASTFTPQGTTLGPMPIPEAAPDSEYPHTLDLRKL